MLGHAFEVSGDTYSAGISYEQSELPGPLTESDYMILGRIFLARGEVSRARTYVKWLRRQKGHDSTIHFLEEELTSSGT